jgi:tetratricopeptide (TPR) repeat protein
MKYLIPLLFLLAAGCSTAPDTDRAAADLEAGARSVPGDADYHLLMAEIALQREDTEVAVSEYLDAALASDDPEVAARAARVAYSYGATEQALGAARRWAALAPEAAEPRELLVRLYVRMGDVAGAVAHMDVLYARSGEGPRRFLPLLPVVAGAGNDEAALEAVEILAGRYERDASGWYTVGAVALRLGRMDRALEASARAASLDPDWSEAAALHARGLAADGRPEEALAYLDARPDADTPVMRLERGILLLSADRIAEARMLLEAVVEEQPGNAAALRALGYLEYFAGDLGDARRSFLALLATGLFMDDAMFYLGSIAEREGDIEEAARMYSRVSAGDHLVTAQVRLALLMYRLGQPAMAIEHLEEFARLNPETDVEVSSATAELWMRMEEPEKALEVYDRLLERNPDSVDALYARSLLYERLDRVDDAIRDMEAVLARRPDDPTALNGLGYTLADRTDRYEEAYELIERAYAQAPDSPAVIDSMGWVMFRLGRYEEAEAHLRRAWELQRDPEIAAHLGEVLWTTGRIDEARDIWTDAIVDFPDDPALRETMGRLDP